MGERLHGWTLARATEWRAVPAESLHVTLVFLGRTPSASVPDLLEATRHAVERLPPPELSVAGVRVVSRRLLAAELADRDGRAASVAHSCAQAFVGLGLHQASERPFWAHLTLARARRGQRPPRPSSGPPKLPRFTTPEVTLFMSRPAAGGPRYSALGGVGLTGSSGA